MTDKRRRKSCARRQKDEARETPASSFCGIVLALPAKHGIADDPALFGIVRKQNGTGRVTPCVTGANRAQLPIVSRRAVMANREQKSNREKKKPKSDKKGAPITTKAPAYIEPQLVRRPHKGKQDY
jgi:hypothetical protein